jgi:hypothetical protein
MHVGVRAWWEESRRIDFENLPAPSEGFLVTHFITVRSVARSRAFYGVCSVTVTSSFSKLRPGSELRWS